MTKAECIAFNSKSVKTGMSTKNYGHTYFARKDFQPGNEIMRGYGRIVDHQTAHKSVQIGQSKHYVPIKWTGAYWNHPCDPNTYMHTRADGFPSLYALKNIKQGDEITYSYAMSEYAWSKGAHENEIICRCGAKNCKKKIHAFSQLSPKEQEQLRRKKVCATYLLRMV